MQVMLIATNDTGAVDDRHALTEFPAVVGRGVEADIDLDDRLVSRRHCLLKWVDGTLVVEDLESSNGTLLNGCRVHLAPLLPGDHLMVGAQIFRVAYERYSLSPLPPTIYGAAREPNTVLPKSPGGPPFPS